MTENPQNGTKPAQKRASIITFGDGHYQFYINNPKKNSKDLKFPSNEIDTRKYNIFTFLPKALFYQFARPANVYFLICAILQCIPMISPLNPLTAVLPIVIVLSASLIREGMEDYARGQLDKQQNNEKCRRYNSETNHWDRTKSGELYVGDIIAVKENGTFPADIILLDSNLPEGICYVETGTLDGEKTLKLKEASKLTGGLYNIQGQKSTIFNMQGVIFADQPNPELYQLNGKMHLKYNNNTTISQDFKICDIPLDSKQLLLKGAKLKNTQWVIGIVVYSGLNCKIMKNSKDPVTKYSSVEKLMNQALIYIFIFQGILCVISAVLRGYYYKKNNLDKAHETFGYTMYRYSYESFFNYFTYLLLLNTLIPISLIITMEVVKIFQGYFMEKDKYSFSHLRKKFLRVNSVSLNEECGMVNYIFTDKTGTLTCNKMVFKYCVIGETCYQYIWSEAEENSEKEKKFRLEENIIPYKMYEMYDNFTGVKKNLNFSNFATNNEIVLTSEDKSDTKLVINSTGTLIEQFWYALSLCHTCSIQYDEDENLEYACVSPDSIELVKAAKNQGWELTESGSTSIKRIQLGNNDKNFIDFERLELIEFSSDRKRETVIVREKGTNNNIIKLYCKGADSIIEERLSKNTPKNILNQCKYYVNKFSVLGFRTLFIAMKILSEEEYNKFSSDLKEAQMSLENKDEKVNEVYNQIEKNLILLGATIVEDKLQDLVPETIRDLRLAKVKVWMLTGDKMNTAYNIGLSCNLISKKMKTFNIIGKEKKVNHELADINKEERDQIILDFAKEFQRFKEEVNSMAKPSFGILVDEKALLTISEDDDIQKIFLDIAKDAETVICCRVSPLQKSQVVKMMKNFDTQGITLAIGDGGNDVPMIMEAHIGVGIYGEEGLRAVQSSDYAMGEFKFLRELLFSHGRMNNVRNSECIHYFFYKNFVETFGHFIYGFYNNFTGQTIIDDWFITLFNLLFTSLPLGTKAILDIDICRDDGDIVYKMLPFIYKENRDSPIFTVGKFALNLIKGLIYSLINNLFVIYSINHIQINKNGQMAGIWFMSVNLYTNILLIVTLTLLITTRYHTWIHFVILIIVTFVAYIVFIIIVQRLTLFNSVGTMQVAFSSPVMWLNIFLISGFSGLIEYFILSFFFVFKPNTVTILQRIFNQSGKIDSLDNLPKSIKDKLNIYNEIGQKTEDKEEKKDDIIKIDKAPTINDDIINNNINTNNDMNNDIKENDINNINTADKDINAINENVDVNIENKEKKNEDENSKDILLKKEFALDNNKFGKDVLLAKSDNTDKEQDKDKEKDKLIIETNKTPNKEQIDKNEDNDKISNKSNKISNHEQTDKDKISNKSNKIVTDEEIYKEKKLSNKNDDMNENNKIEKEKKNDNIEHNSSNNNNEKEEEDFGENYVDDFSEQISKEENINIGSSNYFLGPWDLKNKLSQRKNN